MDGGRHLFSAANERLMKARQPSGRKAEPKEIRRYDLRLSGRRLAWGCGGMAFLQQMGPYLAQPYHEFGPV